MRPAYGSPRLSRIAIIESRASLPISLISGVMFLAARVPASISSLRTSSSSAELGMWKKRL